MIWLSLKIVFSIILFAFGYIFINGFIKGFKQATCLFYDYTLNHIIPKKNNDGLLYELEKERKVFSQP